MVGIDALEVELVDRFVAEGRMPTFARLADTAATVRPVTPLETLPGAIWPELNTGQAGWRTGLFFHPRQIHTGEAGLRPLDEDAVDAESQYWVRAARAGQRVLAVDLPQIVLARDLPTAVQVREWGVHDRQWGTESEPPSTLEEITERWGEPPLDTCDTHHGELTAGYRSLRDSLIEQAREKGEWVSELVARDAWDLVAVAFSEAHCSGHQHFHFFDPESPWHPDDAPPDLVDAIAGVYGALDGAVGSVLEAAGPDATVIVVASHGMSTYIGGYQLLPNVLERLWPPRLAQRALSAPSRLPAPVRAVAQKVVPARWREGRRRRSGEWEGPLALASTKAIAVPNNRVGGIRLNIAGREPNGCLHAGAEVDDTIAAIREALQELRQPSTGEPIVAAVERTDELFPHERHPDLPDLIVRFRQDLGPLEACESPRLGRVEAPVRHPDLPRSGDHTPNARWWIRGPGLAAGPLPVDVEAVDLAPTVLHLLGLEPAVVTDGRAHDLPGTMAR